MNNVGLAVYNWRTSSGLSLSDASKTLGLCINTLSDIEKGKRLPRQNTMKKLENVIGKMDSSEQTAQPEQTTQPVQQEPLPFTERLARSRGFASMDDYMQKTRQLVAQREQADETSNSDVRRDELVRLIGFMEGIQAAIHTDLSKQISILERLANGNVQTSQRENVS